MDLFSESSQIFVIVNVEVGIHVEVALWPV